MNRYHGVRIPDDFLVEGMFPGGRPKGTHIILAERSDGTSVYQGFELAGDVLTGEQAEYAIEKFRIALKCLEANREREV